MTDAGGAAFTLGLTALVLLLQALKRIVVRARPTTRLPHVTALADIPDHFSMPSGHACAALSLAVAVLWSQPWLGALALLLAFVVGASIVMVAFAFSFFVRKPPAQEGGWGH